MSQKPSVLVVDDESGILDTLRILLRNEGFEVTTAQGGKAGLEQIRAGVHDLILSDVRMPQVTGLDILNAAREQDPMTPVILMTAQASLQSAIQAVNSGAFYYLQKPFSNDELVAILRRACEFRQVRVENKQLKQEIRRRDKTAVARPIGKSKRFLELYYSMEFSPERVAGWTAAGSPDECVRHLLAYKELGFSEVTLRITGWDQFGQLERVMQEVLPRVLD